MARSRLIRQVDLVVVVWNHRRHMQSFRPPRHIIQHKCWESRQKAASPQLPNRFLSLDACWWTQTTLVTRLEAEEFALKQLVQNLQVKMWGKWARIAYQALLHLPCTGIRYISPSDAFWTLCPCDRGYETSLKHISAHLLRYLAPQASIAIMYHFYIGSSVGSSNQFISSIFLKLCSPQLQPWRNDYCNWLPNKYVQAECC